MGNLPEGLICRIGLYDTDLKKLSHYLHSSVDYVEAITDIAEFILTRMNRANISKAKHTGELSYYYKAGEIRRVIICHNSQKIVSYHFPFDATPTGDSFQLTINGIEINLEKLAKIKEIIEYFRNSPKASWRNIPITLMDAYEDLGNDETDIIHEDIFKLFYIISTTEPGYLRYDFDPNHDKGKIHPCHHIDINFNNHSAYKYGLYKNLSRDEFEKIFAKHEDKLFLHSFRNDISFLIKPLKRENKNYRKKKLPKKIRKKK